jgi:hypothetical protein
VSDSVLVLLFSSSGISETGVRGALLDCDGKADGVLVAVGVVVVGVSETGVAGSLVDSDGKADAVMVAGVSAVPG